MGIRTFLTKKDTITVVTYVIEVTDFKSEVRFDLRGCLEAVVASEAAKKGQYHIRNMHMN